MMSHSLTYHFEEAPLFRCDNSFEAGFVDGSIDVTYTDDGEWHPGEIKIEVQKGRETKMVYLDDEQDYSIKCSIVFGIYEQIDAAVAEALANDGVTVPNIYDEHRLSHTQLGLSCGARLAGVRA